MSNFLEIALRNAARGWPVFPVVPRDKYPRISKADGGNGFHDATTNVEQVTKWWTAWPDCNIGFYPGGAGMTVLDVDTGLSDMASFLAWRDRNGLPTTYTVRTGRRPEYRVQMYFLGTRADCDGWELDGCKGDIRSLGGYVMAEGSVHPSGATYEALYPGEIPVAPMPGVVARLKTQAHPTAPGEPFNKLRPGDGQHADLTSQAGTLRNMGLDPDQLAAALIAVSDARHDPPLSFGDIEHIARSIGAKPLAAPEPRLVIGKFEAEELAVEDDGRDEYLVESRGAGYEGWFPKGDVSLIGGSSGSGKTYWLMTLLERVRLAADVWGHNSQARDYRVLMHDRGAKGMRRTLNALGLPPEAKERVIRLSSKQQALQPADVLTEYIDRNPTVEAWFIEGLDMWFPDALKMSAVVPILDGLQRLATRRNVAVIATVGAPKEKTAEGQDTARYWGRDALFGSSAMARKCETVVLISKTDMDDADAPRQYSVLPRNGKSERFYMVFVDGKLTPVDKPGPKERKHNGAPNKTEILNSYVALKLKPGDRVVYSSDMGAARNTYTDWLPKAEADGIIERRDGKWWKSPKKGAQTVHECRVRAHLVCSSNKQLAIITSKPNVEGPYAKPPIISNLAKSDVSGAIPGRGDRWGNWRFSGWSNASLDFVGKPYRPSYPYWIRLNPLLTDKGLKWWTDHLETKWWWYEGSNRANFLAAVDALRSGYVRRKE